MQVLHIASGDPVSILYTCDGPVISKSWIQSPTFLYIVLVNRDSHFQNLRSLYIRLPSLPSPSAVDIPASHDSAEVRIIVKLLSQCIPGKSLSSRYSSVYWFSIVSITGRKLAGASKFSIESLSMVIKMSSERRTESSVRLVSNLTHAMVLKRVKSAH
jgi:hypothetical protein